MEEYYPNPGEIDLEENPLGMAQIGLQLNVKVEKNMDCKEPVIITQDGETMSQIFVDTNPEGEGLPSVLVITPDLGFPGLPLASTISIGISEDPYTFPGKYSLVIPDGFFLYEGAPLNGMELEYVIPGSGEIIPSGVISEYLVFSDPEVNSAFTEEDYYLGVSAMIWTFNINGLEMKANPECESKIVLMKQDGEVLSQLGVADVITPEEMDEDTQSFIMIENQEEDEDIEAVSAVMIQFLEEQFVPGKYMVNIPDNFFIATDGVNTYGFEGTIFNYELLPEPLDLTFNDLVYDAYPTPGTEVDLDSNEWNEYGVDGFMFNVDGAYGFEINMDCTEPILVKKGEETIYSALPGNTADDDAYVQVFGFALFSDNADPDFGGNDGDDNFGQDSDEQDPDFGGNDDDDPGFGVDPEDVTTPMGVWIFCYDPETEIGITEAGHYTLVIPDGFFMAGEDLIKGSTYEYDLVSDKGAVELFKAEKEVTVYNVNGMRVLNNAPVESLGNLNKGLYIINGKKVIIM